MKQIFFHSKIKYILCFLFALLVIAFYVVSYGFNLFNFADATFIAGFILVCISGLSFCTQAGTFDIFSYAFANKGVPGKRITFYDYQQRKIEKRKNKKFGCIPYLVVGVFFIIVSVILLAIFNASINVIF